MPKPITIEGYTKEVTENCERVLVTLLHGLGPWKDSIYLVGGLAPRYLVDARPPNVEAHAGTGDVDIVVELQMLADTDAYHSLEENLQKLDFERAENRQGDKVSWRWQVSIDGETRVILEFLADDPETSGGRVQPLPTRGGVSALNIPHASIVFDHHETKEIRAELLGDNGIATENIRYADLVSFTCLKALAYNDRAERKDAHDLIYCIENFPGGLDAVTEVFRRALEGKHADIVSGSLAILQKRFADDKDIEGYRKDGPVAVAKFERGEIDDEETRNARILRQRNVCELITQLLARLQ